MCLRKTKNQKKKISGETRENSFIISVKKKLDLNVCEDTNSRNTPEFRFCFRERITNTRTDEFYVRSEML